MKKKLINGTSLKLKTFAPVKDTIKKMKIQATDWEKILVKHISDKDLYPIYTKNSTIRKQIS